MGQRVTMAGRLVKGCAFLWVLLAAVCLAVADAGERDRPNVVLIISDDHGWSDYGFMGHKQIQTPHLDKLAASGFTFTRGYVPSSLCRPSLATIATGLFPHQHRITGNDPAAPGKVRNRKDPAYQQIIHQYNRIMQDLPTVPRELGKAGYLSFQTGKWWEGHYSTGGFTHGMSLGDLGRGGRHGDAGLEIGRKGMEPIFDFIAEARRENKPFLVWYAPLLPHDPHTPPARLFEKYRTIAPTDHVARYWAMVEWFDETCGQLMSHLEEQNLADNTLVIYVADNGWIQQPNKAGFAPGSKQSPYDGGLRTPIMVRWPAKLKARLDTQTPVSSADIAATIYAACGVKPDADLPGINLLDTDALTKRNAVFGAVYTHDVNDLDDVTASLRFRWGVVGDWKVILPHARHHSDLGSGLRPELYHVTDDPQERRNLSLESAEKLEEMSRRVDEWWTPGR
jgi:uncharacterized sulfatase